jgi:hypothetical protein
MNINVEKGRMLSASCQWIHFIVRNPDIMTTLNKAPFVTSFIDNRHFGGEIFKVKVMMEIIGDKEPKPSGEIDIVADVRMPMGLGKTHTVAHYRYRLIDRDMTMVDLQLGLETTGIIMAIYAFLLKHRINDYLNRVMSDNERAAILIQDNDPCLEQLISLEQIARIDNYRKIYGDTVTAEDNKISTETTHSLEQDKRLWDSELLELTEVYEKFEERTDELRNELIRIRETRDAVATLLIARRMLEVIVGNVCQRNLRRPRGTEPLAAVIDKIARSQQIPEYVITSMSNLNRLSTYGAHPKKFSIRQVREALMALCSIMEWYAGYWQNKDDEENL